MAKYLIKRIVTGLLSVIAVVVIIMILIYSLLDRQQVFALDTNYTNHINNQKTTYMYSKWEEYGYLDYVPYSDWLNELVSDGELDDETRTAVASIGMTADEDSEDVAEYVQKFTEYYEGKGYTVIRLDAITSRGNKVASGGSQQLFAYKDISVFVRAWKYFTNLVSIDNIHNVEDIEGERGLTFTLYDPVYGGEKFSPAIIGNGTTHKYLLYFTSEFPYIHQNFVSINLGVSYSVNTGVDVFTTMTQEQGSYVMAEVTYPTGYVETSADNLHSATYISGSLSGTFNATRFTDNYTSVTTNKNGMSRVGYSFVIGIIASLLAYGLGVPLGIVMALNKDKLIDKLGSLYIIFLIAVPSLAYIFMFRAIGSRLFGLPTSFDLDSTSKLIYVLPIVSLALPSVASLMKWLRRYMIDQMNSDYVKFARSGGLTEGEIFTKHILKNAIIPIVHGIPGTVLGALTGAIITESVYAVPGAGKLLTQAIGVYDNAVIVGVSLFYAVLSVTSLILGDILMSVVDPRISFTSTGR
ncbi:MAG: ABC transporter permease [Lachnospiraceae bacterium]|nr:ABC transporter permease [Lachnospiraceae bacterium]